MLIWLALACSDPEYGSLGDSLKEYDRGIVAMESGDYINASSAFRAAMKADPDRPALIAWYARSLAHAGQNDSALQYYDSGLKRFPDDIDLRYNRAALRAKTGDLTGSAADLRWLYANEAVHPVQVGEDNDFIALGTDPSFSSLIPAAQVEASVQGESGAVLLGETYTVEFSVTSRSGAEVGLSLVGDGIPQLVLHRLVEDVVDIGEIWTRRTLRAEFIGVEEGESLAGPWLISASGTSSLTERVGVEVVRLPEQKPVSSPVPIELAMPSVVWSELEHPGIVQLEGQAWAWMPFGSYIQPRTATDGAKMEYRDGGQPKWSAQRLRKGVEVQLRDGSRVVKSIR